MKLKVLEINVDSLYKKSGSGPGGDGEVRRRELLHAGKGLVALASGLYYTLLYSTLLYYTILYSTLLYSTILYCITIYYTIL